MGEIMILSERPLFPYSVSPDFPLSPAGSLRLIARQKYQLRIMIMVEEESKVVPVFN
jgi:hypothetical protein